jgi:AraC-like DNA-binding protein
MDPLSDVIALMQPESYRVGGFQVGGDWSIRFDAHEGVKCYAVIAGQCWLVIEGVDEPMPLKTGDCFLLPGGRPFCLANNPATPPDNWRQHFLGTPNGALIKVGEGGDTTLIGGFFRVTGSQAELVLGMLPPIIHLHNEADREALRWAFERMRQELADPRPGSFLIAQQLAYMVLVQTLRLHFEKGEGIGSLFALTDRHVGAAIAAVHRDPGRRWTVQGLAAEVGMSRSNFAARFRLLTGEGPMEYVTRWRMLLAGRELARGKLIGSVAQSIGYDSETAFSAAYKRVMGIPPRRHVRGLADAERHAPVVPYEAPPQEAVQ